MAARSLWELAAGNRAPPRAGRGVPDRRRRPGVGRRLRSRWPGVARIRAVPPSSLPRSRSPPASLSRCARRRRRRSQGGWFPGTAASGRCRRACPPGRRRRCRTGYGYRNQEEVTHGRVDFSFAVNTGLRVFLEHFEQLEHAGEMSPGVGAIGAVGAYSSLEPSVWSSADVEDKANCPPRRWCGVHDS
jgi:hypothetical protein